MKTKFNCQLAEQIILQAEGDLDSARLGAEERIAFDAHLESCSPCFTLAKEERQLTALLNSPCSTPPNSEYLLPTRSNWKTSALAISAAIMLIAVGAMGMQWWNSAQTASQLTDAPSLGSMVSRKVFSDVSFTAESKSLKNSNHIELPAGSTATLVLSDAGSIDATGPATFEVDRIQEHWKLTWISGQLKVIVEPEAEIQLAYRHGLQRLLSGVHLINFGDQDFVQTTSASSSDQEVDEQEEDIATRLERGLRVFAADANASKEEQMEAAQLLYDIFHSDEATPTQKLSSGLYGAAALSNTGQYEKVVEIGQEWEATFAGPMEETVAAMMVKAYFSLGQTDVAQTRAADFIESFPDSPYIPMIRSHGGKGIDGASGLSSSGRHQPDLTPPFVSEKESNDFMNGQADGYLVVKVALSPSDKEHQRFADVANKVQEFHDAEIIDFDGRNFEKLKAEIANHKPANVLFVIPPQKLDVNFHRQIFKFAATLDNDPFVDFCWGYLTARNGEELDAFWTRIEKLHRNGLANKNWLETGVIGGNEKSKRIAGGINSWSTDAGFQGDQLYFGCVEQDPQVIGFINQQKSIFENASVIAMTGNGDPQGIWLFDGMRNMDSSLHWSFDPDKVGYDPKNEMLRLKSDWFRELKMQSPVIWSGTCHSGACYRVFVEGDIVSTFGKSETAAIYDLPADESLCLSLIEGGAGALLVPIAANHGLSVTMESYFAVKHGATLGETIKSTYNDVIFQAGGVPKLLLTEEGDAPNFHGEPVMQSGGANRILIGDPALKLFEPTSIAVESESLKLDVENRTLEVRLDWKRGYHGAAWNLFADGRGGNQRMFTRIDCTEIKAFLEGVEGGELSVSAQLTDAIGNEVKSLAIAEVETIGGRSFLHLQASATVDSISSSEHKAIFTLRW